ncbi:CD44 antigen isoform X1 [Phyllostomus discolor]|uniref:CD44 antigen n=1 Tax=Phyllostomus discolor TaxID=89673 RepID=A0A7E6E233_9CHIR|nr:CD44 antigen isoform X1 [Phyllostomus discolor]
MDKIGWRAAWGLCLLHLSLAQIDLNVTCRYSGVFHVEKNGRYSISRTEAADLCAAFNCTLPTMAQMEEARSVGFETCRYGFIEGHVVIPRIHPNSICAANHTGVYILSSNTSQYDTYCFNASAPQGEDCTSITDLPNAFDGPITITIVNRDGTRYTKRGEYRTNPDDINANTTDYDFSSGSPSERSTPTDYTIFHTQLPTEYPTQGGDHPSVPSYPEDASVTTQLLMQVTTAGTDSSVIITAGSEPIEENEDETDKTPSHSGSGIDDDEDFISSTIATTPRVSNIPTQTQDWNKWSPDFFTPDVLLQTTPRMTDVDRSGTSEYGENWTQEPQPPLILHEQHDEEETQHSASTTLATPSSAMEDTATQREQRFTNRWPGEYLQTPREDSHSTAGTDASAHDSHPNQEMTTPSQEDSSWTSFLDPISHPMGRGHQTESMDTDSSDSTTPQPPADPDTGLVEDRTESLSVTTQQSHTQSFSTSQGGLEEDKEQPVTPTAAPSSNDASDDVKGGRTVGNLPEDSTTSAEGVPPHSPDTKEHTTLLPVTPANTGVPTGTEVTTVGDSNVHVDLSLSGDQDSTSDSAGRHHTTHGSKADGHSSGSQGGGASTTSGPIRKPQIPEWLIILASLLALALILAVCIAVNSRRRCGQKKKLVINNGNGAVEDRKPSGLNGEASKSQEMVHLVNKEPSETTDQFMTTDETQNLQNEDVKIGA